MANHGFFAGRIGAALVTACLGLASTGCGALSAIANPKAGWALQEPAPMTVILRRADVARATAKQVERLLGETGVNPQSKWIPKTALKRDESEALLKEIAADSIYSSDPPGQKYRVVNAEVWAEKLAAICSSEAKAPNLIAAINADVATAYAEVAGQSREIGKLKGARAEEEKALDQKEISAADKEDHEKKKAKIEADIDTLEKAYKPKVEALLTKIREDAGKAPDDTKKNLGVGLVNLKRAVEAAKIANSVAVLRYPLAMPNMPQELQSSAKRIAGDVVEDKTGHRPILDGFKPDVKLEGGSVKLSLNGIPVDKLGGLSPPQLLLETTDRLKTHVTRILTLLADVAETQDLLALESDVLDAMIDGLHVEAATLTGAGDDIGELKIETDAAAGAAAAKGGVKKKRPKGLAISTCPGQKPKPKEAPKGKKPSA